MKAQYLLQQPKKLEDMSIKRVGDWIAVQAKDLIRLAGDREELLVHHTGNREELLMRRTGDRKELLVHHTGDREELLICHTGDREKLLMHHIGDREKLLSRHIENIRATIECNVPRFLHNQLFVEGIQALTKLNSKPSTGVSEACKEYIICRMTESLFTKHLSVLYVNIQSSIFQKSLCDKSHLLIGLTELHIYALIKGRSFKDPELKVVQIIKELHNLKKLSYRGHPFHADIIITCIVNNCKLLEELNVSGCIINFKLANIISKLSNLVSLNVQYTGISETGIAKILESCKSIEHIFQDANRLERGFEQIKLTSAENAKPQFNLKSYQNNAMTTFEQFQLIVSMCPKVEEIILTKSIDNNYYLSTLLDLQYLHELKLSNYDFYGDQVKDILEILGQNLTVLSFEGVIPISLNELMYIARTCLNLESLSINKSDRYEMMKPHNTTLLGREKGKNPSFSKLKTLFFQHEEIDLTQSIFEELIFILCHSPNIEFINTWVPINNDMMSTVLDANPLFYLRQFKIINCNISRQIVDRITQSCRNAPEIINLLDIPLTDSDHEEIH